jgi:hypothetical protein
VAKITLSQKKILKGLLHEIVLLRDKACLKCGNPEFQMSHIYSVGAHKRMEYDPDNVKALCVRHHLYWWHKEPIEAHEWLKTVIPKERLDRLRLLSQQSGPTGFNYKLHKLFLEKEIEKLK